MVQLLKIKVQVTCIWAKECILDVCMCIGVYVYLCICVCVCVCVRM